MDFIITIDVEEDNPWERPRDPGTRNSAYILPFQDLCDRYMMKPTYLCSYEMVTCKVFQHFIGPVLRDGTAEVGAHLHPWRCPPIQEITNEDYKYIPYPHEYADALVRAKLETLARTIKESLGVQPRSYRAGRWGLITSHIPFLEELGFVADSSVTPMVSWKATPGLPDGIGGIDFTCAPIHPHFLYHDESRLRMSKILEVPVTILFPFAAFNQWNVRWKFFTDNKHPLIAKILRRLGLTPAWMRPYAYMDVKDLIRIYRRACGLDLPCINMMFHSNELMPGGSPYHTDEKSVDLLYGKLEKFFEFLAEEHVRGVTLYEFARMFGKREGYDAS